ncbi:hypothetical protein [Aneurinibacillus soli]|nr:hypothetical protein [Aneurinibacillus soli]
MDEVEQLDLFPAIPDISPPQLPVQRLKKERRKQLIGNQCTLDFEAPKVDKPDEQADSVLQAIRESIIGRSRTGDRFGKHIDQGFKITKCEKHFVWSTEITYMVKGCSDTATFTMLGVNLTHRNEPIPRQMIFGYVRD